MKKEIEGKPLNSKIFYNKDGKERSKKKRQDKEDYSDT